MFIAFGLIFIVASRAYNMGTAAKMGPAYFPTMLGGLLVFLGILIGAAGFRAKAQELRIERFQAKPILTILIGVALFALLLPKMGLVVSLVLLILISSLASHEFSLRASLIATVVLLLMSWVVFVKGLELQFPLLPAFLMAQ
jgi:hypothetical protein